MRLESHSAGAVAVVAMALVSASPLAAASISGRVYQRTGEELKPLPRVKVTARPVGEPWVLAIARSDDKGRYLLPVPEPRVRLDAYKPAFYVESIAGKETERLVLDCSDPEDCRGIDFVLVRGSVVTGRVLDEYGEPLQDVLVDLTLPSELEDGRVLYLRGGMTNDLGEFRVPGLRPGRHDGKAHELRAPWLAFGGREPETLQVEIGEGELVSGLEITMRMPRQKPFVVAGKVEGVDLERSGVHMLVLRRLPGPGLGQRARYSTVLPLDGSFRMPEVYPGRYLTRYQFGPRSQNRVEEDTYLGIHEMDRDVKNLVLSPRRLASLSGTVALPAGLRPGALDVWIRSQETLDSQTASPHRSPFGDSFSFSELVPGRYRLGVSNSVGNGDFYLKSVTRGEDTASESIVDLAEGSHTSLHLVLAADFATIAGRVRAGPSEAGGTSEAGAYHLVALRGHREVRTVQADQNGLFRFEKVIPGEYEICAWSDLTRAEVQSDSAWEQARNAVRSFPADPDSDIEITLTAAR